MVAISNGLEIVNRVVALRIKNKITIITFILDPISPYHSLMDPFRDCERLYDNHCLDRMTQRHLPEDQVAKALREGNKIRDEKGEYSIKWNKWCLKVSVGECFVYLWTAFRIP